MKIVNLPFLLAIAFSLFLGACGRAVNCPLLKDRLNTCYGSAGIGLSAALQAQIDDAQSLCTANNNQSTRSENFYRWHDCVLGLGQDNSSSAAPTCTADNINSTDVNLNPILNCNSLLSVSIIQ